MGDEPTVLLSVLLYEKDLLPEMQDVSLRMFLEYLRVKEKEEAPHGAREGGMKSFRKNQAYMDGFMVGRETTYKEIADCFAEEGAKRISGKRIAWIVRGAMRLQQLEREREKK